MKYDIIALMKTNRHEKIIELITEHEISTQEELVKLLNNEGYNVTQATVSRDIKALHLEKVPTKKGSKYFYPESKVVDKEKYLRILSDGYANILQAGNMIVVKTVSGMAMAVAAALDNLKFHEIVGSIAGDDTIMCATKSDADAACVIGKIKSLIK